MIIADLQPSSFIDYPDKISVVLFTRGCNFKCPACHAKKILDTDNNNIEVDSLWEYLKNRRIWADAVVLCGGEPTLQADILEFSMELKRIGYCVKLDTNGSRPDVLDRLITKQAIDYAAMDIKAPPHLYSNVCGVEIDLKKIENSLSILSRFNNYELRTTLAPFYGENKKSIRFLDEIDMVSAANWVKTVSGKTSHRYFIQRFISRQGGLLDPKMEQFAEAPDNLIKKVYYEVRKILPNCFIR
ncbi:anaerobic ribonucleoside-triphosphate reductase activating protein [bacterium]|nr:anaerobic ribonucleoside-triphosphate reductase activating protein [bacterium]